MRKNVKLLCSIFNTTLILYFFLLILNNILKIAIFLKHQNILKYILTKSPSLIIFFLLFMVFLKPSEKKLKDARTVVLKIKKKKKPALESKIYGPTYLKLMTKRKKSWISQKASVYYTPVGVPLKKFKLLIIRNLIK